jgi:hypothetical protein
VALGFSHGLVLLPELLYLLVLKISRLKGDNQPDVVQIQENVEEDINVENQNKVQEPVGEVEEEEISSDDNDSQADVRERNIEDLEDDKVKIEEGLEPLVAFHHHIDLLRVPQYQHHFLSYLLHLSPQHPHILHHPGTYHLQLEDDKVKIEEGQNVNDESLYAFENQAFQQSDLLEAEKSSEPKDTEAQEVVQDHERSPEPQGSESSDAPTGS